MHQEKGEGRKSQHMREGDSAQRLAHGQTQLQLTDVGQRREAGGVGENIGEILAGRANLQSVKFRTTKD
jgi:hypothetical protein